MLKSLFPLTLVVAVLAGCSTSAPVSLGGGQYSITASNHLAWDGAGQQNEAVKAAHEFCAKEGKTARITSMKATDAIASFRVASGQVTFVCEDAVSDDEPVEMAGGVYTLAGSSSGYQGIQARHESIKKASRFCAKKGLKVLPVDATRETSANYTSAFGAADTTNSAESALQRSSADLMFKCVK